MRGFGGLLFALTILALYQEVLCKAKGPHSHFEKPGVWKFREEWLSTFLTALSSLDPNCKDKGSNTLINIFNYVKIIGDTAKDETLMPSLFKFWDNNGHNKGIGIETQERWALKKMSCGNAKKCNSGCHKTGEENIL